MTMPIDEDMMQYSKCFLKQIQLFQSSDESFLLQNQIPHHHLLHVLHRLLQLDQRHLLDTSVEFCLKNENKKESQNNLK